MILPGKHLKVDRSLLGIGGDILSAMGQESTVSELWERVRDRKQRLGSSMSFDWFILGLSFLYTIKAIDYSNGLLIRKRK